MAAVLKTARAGDSPRGFESLTLRSCLESRHVRHLSRVLGDRRPGPSARASLFVAPVGAGWVDVVGGQDFPGSQFDDGDAGLVGDGEDFCAAVGGADAEVVHAAGVADADLAGGVDVVIT